MTRGRPRVDTIKVSITLYRTVYESLHTQSIGQPRPFATWLAMKLEEWAKAPVEPTKELEQTVETINVE